ncbi:hypothetical protein PoB_003606400 [Plakobranchus ocellatus]|uniref:Uncharacterized protein n=1 Tax=Plakobranchus ocellatus TaxID=259542 RepID=A0AAV4AP39_9GAST|nr:hypothetical protein PoB_003606400 [Plakobranchus ocellatus]
MPLQTFYIAFRGAVAHLVGQSATKSEVRVSNPSPGQAVFQWNAPGCPPSTKWVARRNSRLRIYHYDRGVGGITSGEAASQSAGASLSQVRTRAGHRRPGLRRDLKA